jgi:hypothetical protein
MQFPAGVYRPNTDPFFSSLFLSPTRNNHRNHNRFGRRLRTRFDIQNHSLDGYCRCCAADRVTPFHLHGDSHFGARHFLFLPPTLGAFIMQVQDRYFQAAIDVLDWDLPEGSYSSAVNAQACHLVGADADDVWRYDLGRSVH